MKGYVLVEGHGEVEAVPNLLNRLQVDLELPFLPWSTPLRWPKLHRREDLARGCRYVRSKKDAGALLVLRDEDDDCPRTVGPEVARWVVELELPFPVAVVLLHREYEVLFLPCAERMAGRPLEDRLGRRRPGLHPGTTFEGDPEAVRGVKEWLSGHFDAGRSYKPTLDQLPLTRMIDFALVRQAKVPCFGTLERALRFLAENLGRAGGVYPPPAESRAEDPLIPSRP
jgi:hypothetical protein